MNEWPEAVTKGAMPCNNLTNEKVQKVRNIESSIGILESQIDLLCQVQGELYTRLEPVLNKNTLIKGIGKNTEEKEPESSPLDTALRKFIRILNRLENENKNIINQLDL